MSCVINIYKLLEGIASANEKLLILLCEADQSVRKRKIHTQSMSLCPTRIFARLLREISKKNTSVTERVRLLSSILRKNFAALYDSTINKITTESQVTIQDPTSTMQSETVPSPTDLWHQFT